MNKEVGSEKALGRRLQEARQKAGLTQQDLCVKAGISYSTLAKIERGAIRAPSVFTIVSIASVIGTSLDELAGHNVNDSKPTEKKQSKSGVKFVFFDINGTLVRFYHRAFTAIARDSGQSPDVIESAFWHYNDQVCRGELSMNDFNRALGKKYGMPSFDWRGYYLDSVEPIKEMSSLLEWVAKHYRLGLLTNIMTGQVDSLIKKGIIPDVNYDTVVDSSEVGAIKPEPKIYKIAATLAAADPAEILLVDDTRANLMGAEKAGWKVLWFDDFHPSVSIDRVKKSLAF